LTKDHQPGCGFITLKAAHWRRRVDRVLSRPRRADAILNRLIRNAHKLVLKGESDAEGDPFRRAASLRQGRFHYRRHKARRDAMWLP